MRARLGLSVWLLSLTMPLLGTGLARAETVREFPLPTSAFPGGVAVAPDGGVWVSVMHADTLLRFDPASNRFTAVKLQKRSYPRGLLVDSRGDLWYAASGLGLVGRLSQEGGTPKEFAIPSIVIPRKALPAAWALALDRRGGEVWFTVHSEGLVGRVGVGAEPVRRGFRVRELKLGELTVRPDGIAADSRGGIWVAELGANRLARIDSGDGSIRRLPLPPGSSPRGLATAPDGAIWAGLFQSHRLLRVDPSSFKMRAWPMPSGERSSPYAVTVDSAGGVWVSEYSANTIVRFDPTTERFRVFPLPTPRSRVQAIAADREGRLWYVGGFSGRLGVIE